MKALLLALLILPGQGEVIKPADKRSEEWRDSYRHPSATADARVDTKYHIRNEGGVDGAGLCVIASMVIGGAYQAVADLPELKGSALWRAAKKAPGGYYPEKFQRLATQAMPGVKYTSYEGTDDSILEEWSKAGYPVGVTMNTGRLYGYKGIHHMVTLIYYRKGGMACIVDNNNPGVFSWMKASEFYSRWLDGGVGWAMRWDKKPPFVPWDLPFNLTPRVFWLLVADAILIVLLLARDVRLAGVSRFIDPGLIPAYLRSNAMRLAACVLAVALAAPAASWGQTMGQYRIKTPGGGEAVVTGWADTAGSIHYYKTPENLAAIQRADAEKAAEGDGDMISAFPPGSFELNGVARDKLVQSTAGRITTNNPASLDLGRRYGVEVDLVSDDSPTPDIAHDQATDDPAEDLAKTLALPGAILALGAYILFRHRGV